MLLLIFVALIVSFIFVLIRIIYSLISRFIIEKFVFEGMSNADINRLQKSQPFVKWLFITFIWKYNPTGKARLGLATWFFIWHHISAAATVLYILQIWLGVFFELFFNHGFYIDAYILGIHITQESVDTLLLYLVFATLPVSGILTLPFIFFLRKENVDVPVPEPSLEDKKRSTRTSERDTTVMSRFDRFGYRVTNAVFSLPFRILGAMDGQLPKRALNDEQMKFVQRRRRRGWIIGGIIFLALIIAAIIQRLSQ